MICKSSSSRKAIQTYSDSLIPGFAEAESRTSLEGQLPGPSEKGAGLLFILLSAAPHLIIRNAFNGSP